MQHISTRPFAALSRIEALAHFVTATSPTDTAALAEIVHLAQEVSNDLDVEAAHV